jgi:2-polyprenyl-6-methoxyphenol hydroxylase-like FAD-dependent oxidoreductase
VGDFSAVVTRAVVVGGGVAGLGSALALSRAGWAVTLIERDPTPLPPNPDAAFEWDRRGAPQVRHSHALLARLRNLLRDHYRDVLQALLDAGATEIRFCDLLPEDIADRDPRPGDDDLVALACRRTTFEWVLRRCVLASPGVELHHGATVEGLRSRPDGPKPHVTGVVLGDGTALDADLVVGAVGRRSAIPRWLGAIGVEVDEVDEDTGIVYLSRFYRLAEGAEFPHAAGPIGGDLGYLKYGVFQGDNRTFSITLAVRTHDDELRGLLLDPEGFGRAAQALPATTEWVASARAAPITPVHVMGGLLNRHIDFVDDSGEPRVLGFHAVGDAHTCTNPLYGRGCSLAMVQAHLLAQAAVDHPADAAARGRRYEAACAQIVTPWYRAAVDQDRMARRQAEHEAAQATRRSASDGDDDGEAGDDPGAFVREVLRDGLLPAVRTDATVFRSFIRTFNLLVPPDSMLTDPDVFGRVLAVYQDRDNRPAEPRLGPPRREMLAELTGST